MTEQITDTTTLAALAEHAAATGAWWQEDTLDHPSEMALPTRVLVALGNAGIVTVAQLKAAGPAKLREIPHLGKQGFDQIIALLRALDRQNGGSNGGHQR